MNAGTEPDLEILPVKRAAEMQSPAAPTRYQRVALPRLASGQESESGRRKNGTGRCLQPGLVRHFVPGSEFFGGIVDDWARQRLSQTGPKGEKNQEEAGPENAELDGLNARRPCRRTARVWWNRPKWETSRTSVGLCRRYG